MIDLISLATNFTGLGGPSISLSGIANSPLAHHLIEHEIVHTLLSMVKGKGRQSRLSLVQRRKLINRRRRWFTDNIIMHHKRLHDRNRELVIASVRQKVLAKKNASSNPIKPAQSYIWRDRVEGKKDYGRQIRGRIEARRTRARSRWISIKNVVQLQKPTTDASTQNPLRGDAGA